MRISGLSVIMSPDRISQHCCRLGQLELLTGGGSIYIANTRTTRQRPEFSTTTMRVNSRAIVGSGDTQYSRSPRQVQLNSSFPDVGKYRVIVGLVSLWFSQAHLIGGPKGSALT